MPNALRCFLLPLAKRVYVAGVSRLGRCSAGYRLSPRSGWIGVLHVVPPPIDLHFASSQRLADGGNSFSMRFLPTSLANPLGRLLRCIVQRWSIAAMFWRSRECTEGE